MGSLQNLTERAQFILNHEASNVRCYWTNVWLKKSDIKDLYIHHYKYLFQIDPSRRKAITRINNVKKSPRKLVVQDGWEKFLKLEADFRQRAIRATFQGKHEKASENDIRQYFSQTSATARCPIGNSDVYHTNSRDNKPRQYCAIFVNAITGTIISPRPGNDLIASTIPELKGGFTKNRTDGGSLAINFTVLPYGRDIMNHLEMKQCTSKIWVARKLKKLAAFCWDPRNDLGQQYAGGRSCTLLIATINHLI